MHYHAEVWIKDNDLPGQVEEAVSDAMGPYKEETGRNNTFWDWYQIGGRFKGVHLPEYDPCTDQSNMDRTGKNIDWPIHWPPHPLDVIPVDKIDPSLTTYTIVLPGQVVHGDGMEVGKLLSDYGIATGYLVTVDYHS